MTVQPSTLPSRGALAQAFLRTAFASFLAAAKDDEGRTGRGYSSLTDDFARRRYPDDSVTQTLAAVLTRGAVAGATTTAPGWAADIAGTATGAFLASLAPLSAIGRLMRAENSFTLEGEVATLKLPYRVGNPTASAWVGEGAPIPVTSGTLGAATLGPARKLASEIILSRELAKRVHGESVFAQMLREEVARGLDAGLLSNAAATAVRPAGLLNGVTPLAAATGGGREAMEADLVRLAAAVAAAGGSGDVVFIAAPAQAGAIRIRSPEAAIEVLSSPALPGGTVIALDPQSIAFGTGPTPEIVSSGAAVLHISDTPAQIATTGTPNLVAAPVQSMFATAQIATRVILDVAGVLRRPGLAQYIEGVWW